MPGSASIGIVRQRFVLRRSVTFFVVGFGAAPVFGTNVVRSVTARRPFRRRVLRALAFGFSVTRTLPGFLTMILVEAMRTGLAVRARTVSPEAWA